MLASRIDPSCLPPIRLWIIAFHSSGRGALCHALPQLCVATSSMACMVTPRLCKVGLGNSRGDAVETTSERKEGVLWLATCKQMWIGALVNARKQGHDGGHCCDIESETSHSSDHQFKDMNETFVNTTEHLSVLLNKNINFAEA